jgi:hypothetical protein
MSKGELPVAQSEKQKRRDAIAGIVGDVFERITFPAEKADLLALSRGVELQAGRGRVLMLSDILDNAYQESFSSLAEVVECVHSSIDAA